MNALAKSTNASSDSAADFRLRGYGFYPIARQRYVYFECNSWRACRYYLEKIRDLMYGPHYETYDRQVSQDLKQESPVFEIDSEDQAQPNDIKSPVNSPSVSQQEIILIVVLICIILAFVVLLVTIKMKFTALVKAQMAQRRILRSRASNLSANRRTENQYIVPGTVGLNGRHSLLEGREETHAIININPNRLTATRQSIHANRSEQTGNHIVPPVVNNANQPDQNGGNSYVQIGMNNNDSA